MMLFIFLLAIAIPMVRWFQIDAAMLGSQNFVKGKTTGLCEVFGRGRGISFEYEVAGRKHVGCSTFHPLELNSIKVPDGYYLVRY
ncbi:MAG: hypothetical protein HKN76_16190, partial [Saprospiraceae bacterium]|nr:hypothetical protein [Saprospiraceae bacterium]